MTQHTTGDAPSKVRNTLPNLLLTGGILSSLVFWITLFLSASFTEDYSHLSNLVSELGIVGRRTQYAFTAGLVLSSVLSIFFISGLLRSAKSRGLPTLPIWIMLTFSFSIFGAAVFPLPYRLHGILGSPSMLMPLSPLLVLFLWKNRRIPGILPLSIVTLIVMSLGFLVLFPGVLADWIGLKQRFFHLGWSIWFVGLAWIFLRLDHT